MEGRELLARTALFFLTQRNPFATKAKPSSKGISHFCILAFLLAVTVSRRDGRKVLQSFPMPYSFRHNLLPEQCASRHLPMPSAGSVPWPCQQQESMLLSHLSTLKGTIFWDGIRPCCLIYGEGAGCVGLSSGWVSSISLGCPHHYSLSALSSNTLIYYCGRND